MPGCPRTSRGRLTLLALALVAAAALASPAVAQQPSRLRIAIPADDGSLTPYTFESGYAFMTLVYDTLTWRDAEGIARPWLARSVKHDATGRTVTVRLHEGVRWHDGQPLTADDVAFTYRYMAQRPHPRFTPELQDIAAIGVSGASTVIFHLRHRTPGFEDQPLADVPILPRHLWAGLAPGRKAPPGLPVGTGPYRMTRHVQGRSYRFEANERYFRGAPSIARIDVPVIRRQVDIATELRSRRVDAVPLTVAPGTPTQHLPGVTFSPELSFTGTMLLFDVARPPFESLAARRAVARALDLDTIAGNATRVPGGTVPADRGMLHPQSRWASAGVLQRFDPQAARIAFAEQGVGAFRVAVARNDPVRLETARRVVRALDDVGARARLVALSPAALDRALGRRDRRASFDAAVVGIPALASYDPDFLRAMFGDPAVATLNDGGYRSAAFDRLAAGVASALNARVRRAAVRRELRFLARDLPAVPLLFGGGTFAYRAAAYDRWIGVRGTGILDKRSFLVGAAPSAAPPGRGGPSADLIDHNSNGDFSLVPVIVAFVVLVLAGGLWWLRRRR
ncbi:MAG: peptide/nickel transport system substrate-binding protein [Solirubrobacteraceae bacterium]|nr:peptide/nickel transport system substrate-binding protein [Solirubrobacteraceae bacterium]